MSDDVPAWADDLGAFLSRGWDALERAADDPSAPMHRAVLATTGLGGGAEARTLVLRHARRSDATLGVQVDRASTKVAEIGANPLATLLFWDEDAQMQIRARIRAEIDTDTAAIWTDLSDRARTNYGGTPPTGAPIPAASAYDKVPDPDRLARIMGHVQSFDFVYLGPEHRRALFSRDNGFAGTWLAP
ncbi:pyridoxamine 5'-phosphate oxidase family protein [Palleronia sp. LCG004]|uniref:pyridoxamine 5'-phosphate oxidase family protein n=1 Tax=Palleronia sp. LCG004 TaxID=3079304 RepID=UPI002941C5B6|nr:pyridoxamine 5'-phosphate oxidase family protein [Palleronia sp. LCG004]WOI55046.1 pyridoxamine 5'-phosphate oxidase family protein [Palleronia sp. LCG004]